MQERGHIINILKNALKSLEKGDSSKIKNLSNQIIHQAAMEQDPDIISLAVIIYSLSKLIERENYKEEKNWESFYNKSVKNINGMINSLKENNLDKFRLEIEENRYIISGLSGKLKYYIQDVFKKAKINKASRIYEHGISMEKTAKILGISVWELAEYAGQSGISDVNLALTMPIRDRIKLAQEIFR